MSVAPPGFRHEALTYDGADACVPAAAGVVREGLARDERTLVLASDARLRELSDALGPDADEVTLVATDQHARNPARVAAVLDTFRSGAPAGAQSRGVSVPAPGRTRAVALESRFADSVLNLARVSAWALSLVCLFDDTALDDATRRHVREDHQFLRAAAADGADNPDFRPLAAEELFSGPLSEPLPGAATTVITTGGLPRARSFVRTRAAGIGLRARVVDDLVLAVNEIVTNSLRYGGGTAWLAAWPEDGGLVCEVRDRGVITDPLAGRFAPPASADGGRGLWLVNQLCDLVQLRSSPSLGTVVRMWVEA